MTESIITSEDYQTPEQSTSSSRSVDEQRFQKIKKKRRITGRKQVRRERLRRQDRKKSERIRGGMMMIHLDRTMRHTQPSKRN